jgi:hypothetical protein
MTSFFKSVALSASAVGLGVCTGVAIPPMWAGGQGDRTLSQSEPHFIQLQVCRFLCDHSLASLCVAITPCLHAHTVEKPFLSTGTTHTLFLINIALHYAQAASVALSSSGALLSTVLQGQRARSTSRSALPTADDESWCIMPCWWKARE